MSGLGSKLISLLLSELDTFDTFKILSKYIMQILKIYIYISNFMDVLLMKYHIKAQKIFCNLIYYLDAMYRSKNNERLNAVIRLKNLRITAVVGPKLISG